MSLIRHSMAGGAISFKSVSVSMHGANTRRQGEDLGRTDCSLARWPRITCWFDIIQCDATFRGCGFLGNRFIHASGRDNHQQANFMDIIRVIRFYSGSINLRPFIDQADTPKLRFTTWDQCLSTGSRSGQDWLFCGHFLHGWIMGAREFMVYHILIYVHGIIYVLLSIMPCTIIYYQYLHAHIILNWYEHWYCCGQDLLHCKKM